MTIESLGKRIADGEDRKTAFFLEANRAVEISRTVCALLNAEGGAVFCGIGEGGRTVGISGNASELARDLELAVKKSISPTPLLTVASVVLDDHPIIVVDVPRGRDQPYVADGGIWLRNGAETIAANIAMLKDLLLAKVEVSERWERRISPSLSTGELDRDEIRATVRDAETASRFPFKDHKDDLMVLRDLSVLTDAGFTQGADVLFTRSAVRRHPQCRVQLLRSSGNKSGDAIEDIRWFEGPLVRVCRELLSAVEAALPVRSEFPRNDARRIDRRAYDSAAVREGVVNAFVHRDYSAYSGGMRVSMYESQIEIWNSGRLTGGLTPGSLRRDHPSIPVNPDIAQVFYLRAFMERIGRGTEKIIRAARELRAPPPVWRDDPTGVTLTLFASRLSGASDYSLNVRQKMLFMTLHAGDEITLSEYSARFASAVTQRQARRDLEELEGFGFLERRGRGRATNYRLTPKAPTHSANPDIIRT